METREMKQVLAQKFKDEESGLRYSDISIQKIKELDEEDYPIKDVYMIVIKGYEHIKFAVYTEVDKFFGNEVWVAERHYYDDDTQYESDIIDMQDSKTKGFDELMRLSLISLGYHIANTF